MKLLKELAVILLIIGSFWLGTAAGAQKAGKIAFNEGIAFAENQQQEKVYESIVTNITYCESRDVHNRTSWAGAYGRAQFMERTFNWMKKLAGKPGLQWRNENDQMWLLNWAVRNGYGSHWQTCYRQAVVKSTETLIASISF